MTVTATPPDEKAAPTKAEKGAKKKKAKLVIIVVVVLALGGAGYFFLLKPSGSQPVEPGAVVPLDHVQINLAEGHYLRLGLSLQLTSAVDAEEGGSFDGSKALDAAIEIFSGRTVEDLAKGAHRDKLKKELAAELEHRYEGEVMDVYFTEFVTE